MWWTTTVVVDSLQTSVAATTAMAAVPAGVKQQNGRLDSCCYGECFLVHTGQVGRASEQGYVVIRHKQYARYSQRAVAENRSTKG